MQNHFVSGVPFATVERDKIGPPINYLFFLLHLEHETTVRTMQPLYSTGL